MRQRPGDLEAFPRQLFQRLEGELFPRRRAVAKLFENREQVVRGPPGGTRYGQQLQKQMREGSVVGCHARQNYFPVSDPTIAPQPDVVPVFRICHEARQFHPTTFGFHCCSDPRCGFLASSPHHLVERGEPVRGALGHLGGRLPACGCACQGLG